MVRGCKLQKLKEVAHDHKMPRRVEKEKLSANGKLEKGEKILIKSLLLPFAFVSLAHLNSFIYVLTGVIHWLT